jgi:RHS repeat-associated protein
MPRGWRSAEATGFVEGRSRELEELTTETRQVFRNPDGTFTDRQATAPVRFRDDSGAWRDLDWHPVSEQGRWKPRASRPGRSVGATADDQSLVQASTSVGPVGLRQNGAKAVKGIVDGERIVFPGALGDAVDLAVELLPSGFETTLVVPGAQAERSTFEQVITLPPGTVARQSASGIELVDGSGSVVGTYGSGSAIDSAAHPAEAPVRTTLVTQAGGSATVSVSVDADWLGADDRVFPVSIDPTFTQTTADAGNLDTFVQSNIATTSQAGSPDLKIGKVFGDSAVRRALLRFDTSSIVGPNRVVLSADLALWNSYTPSCTPKAMEVRSLAGPFNASTVWSNQPGYGGTLITTPSFAKGYSGCAEGWQSVDITSLAQKWVDGSANHGIGLKAVSESDDLGGKYFRSAESWVPPTLTVTYGLPPTNGALASPADGASIVSTQPTLSVNPGVDPDGDPLRYWFTVSTNPDGSGQVLSSGWQPAGVTSWKVPAGSLLDGTTYYWTAATWDGITWPSDPPPTRALTVDFRLGDAGTWPFDELGPVKVNLATGNVIVSAASPSFETVGGDLGAAFTYNSQAAPTSGWTGRYFASVDAATKRPPAGTEPSIVRRDTSGQFLWGGGSPGAGVPADNFYVKWSGYLRVPVAGGYKLGATCATPTAPSSTGGVRVSFSAAVQDAWGACNPAPSDPWTATVTLAAGQVVPIEVEYWSGAGSANVNLKVRGPGLPSGVNGGINVPAAWLSTSMPALPQGWTLSADLDGSATYRQAVIGGDAVTFVDADETSHRYRWDAIGQAYVPPPGEDGRVGRSTSGGVTLIDADGAVHVFGADGRLLSVTSALDDQHPAATRMTWSGEPLRLSALTDPVSGRNVVLRYSGDAGCPSDVPSGLASAPGGMLCEVDYGDFEAGHTELWYNANGQLARVIDPGDEVTDFAYDTGGRLAKVRDPLASDAVAASVRADDDSTFTALSYDAAGRAIAVALPEPNAGESRPTHSYDFIDAATTDVHAEGLTSSSGRMRRVAFDAEGRVTSDSDEAGRATFTAWDAQDRVTTTWDPSTGLKSTNVYDALGSLTDEWGPAPIAWWPSPAATGPPSAAHTAATPHEVTRYDEGIGTLAATWWDNPDFSGTPDGRTTGVGTSTGEVYASWGTGGPAVLGGGIHDFSGRLTGFVNLANSTPWTFRIMSLAGRIRVLVGDRLVVDGWNPGTSTTIDGTYTPDSPGWKPITIEYSNPAGTASFGTWWRQGAASFVRIPPAALKPGYGLETSATDEDGATSTTSYTDSSTGLGPEDGLATSTVTDATGLALTASTRYEADGYHRETGSRLPTGAPSQSATTYYGDAEARDLPCPGAGTAVNQGGAVKVARAPDPSGSGTGGIAQEVVYDAQGRAAATRVVADGEAWTCTSFDQRGRTTQVVVPTVNGRPGRTTTMAYSLLGNPLARTVVDDGSGADDSSTGELLDLLGRTRVYEDAWGNVTTTTYDQVGRVSSVVSPLGTESMTYNADGTAGPTVLDGQTLATPHYDGAGRLDWVEYANGARSDPVTRDALGRETSAVWRRASDGLALASDVVTRRLGGDITDEVVDGFDANPSGPNFTYDTAGRLIEAWTSARTPTGASSSLHTRYGFGAADASCSGNSVTSAGRNTNRTSRTVGDGASATTTTYCYDAADRLIATSEPGAGSIAYDDHGNTTELWGEQRTYDASDRHMGTTKGESEVTYRRDPGGRIIERTASGEPTRRYGFTEDADSPDLVMDADAQVVERMIALPGGGLLTKRAGSNVWSLPNVHGDLVVTVDDQASAVGAPSNFDAFGVPTSATQPDNASGDLDYGWLGEHQRPAEHAAGLAQTIEMGARQYDPVLGRFLEVDPIEGGSANDYDYANADPINQFDLDGSWCGPGCWRKKAKKLASRAWRSTKRVGRWAYKHREKFALAASVAGLITCTACAVAGWAATAYYGATTAHSCYRRRWGQCAVGVASLGLDLGARGWKSAGTRLEARGEAWAARRWGVRRALSSRLIRRGGAWRAIGTRWSRYSVAVTSGAYGYYCRWRRC